MTTSIQQQIDHPVFSDLVWQATEAGRTFGAAESLTGGLFGFLVTRQPGSGDVFSGSIVSYHTDVKRDLLKVPPGKVVSAAAAEAMAQSACGLLECEVAVSLTGVAGPETQDGMEVGTVYLATYEREGPTTSAHHLFEGSPDQVRLSASVVAAQAVIGRLTAPVPEFPGWGVPAEGRRGRDTTD